MKKLLTTLLVIALVLSFAIGLVACGDNKGTQQNGDNTGKTTETLDVDTAKTALADAAAKTNAKTNVKASARSTSVYTIHGEVDTTVEEGESILLGSGDTLKAKSQYRRTQGGDAYWCAMAGKCSDGELHLFIEYTGGETDEIHSEESYIDQDEIIENVFGTPYFYFVSIDEIFDFFDDLYDVDLAAKQYGDHALTEAKKETDNGNVRYTFRLASSETYSSGTTDTDITIVVENGLITAINGHAEVASLDRSYLAVCDFTCTIQYDYTTDFELPAIK